MTAMTPDKVEAALGVFIEQMDILRDDFVRYQEGQKSVPFVVLRESLVAALNAYDECDLSVLTEALAERGVSAPTPCLWIQDLDDGSWDTGCGDKHQFTEGDICDNGHHFCPYCGGRIFETNEPTDDAAMKETP